MSITTTQTTQTTHRATLAGGIHVSINHGTFRATLTLSEPGRALTLALTPEQVAEMAQWESCTSTHPDIPDPEPCAATEYVWTDASDFIYHRLVRPPLRVPHDIAKTHGATDIATLRALARAYQEAQP